MNKAQNKSTDDSNLRLRRSGKNHLKGQAWSVEKRIECVTKYLALGNMRLVADLTGVSYSLLRIWKMQDWWQTMEAEVRASRRLQTDSKLSKLVDKALETVGDRLEHGDFFYNVKDGSIDRRPVQMKDAVKAASELMQRQKDLAKMEQEEVQTITQKSIEEQLQMLASEFAKFNTKRTVELAKPEDITDIEEEDDALHDEWEEGLQEGEEGVRGREPVAEEESSQE
jgi:hypothetical protein